MKGEIISSFLFIIGIIALYSKKLSIFFKIKKERLIKNSNSYKRNVKIND
ncbi:MAG: hypothetical protein KatS3mg068_1772 [Candidatus Sericytochromatia bacterium]|nr:MAG: hypothetical protein KatS3mg068_1772 [Candidatus Sericytochromatia bacterium]